MVAHSYPTSETGVQILTQLQLGKLVLHAIGGWFTEQNLDQLYVLVSSALLTTCHNITDNVLGVVLNSK